MNLSEKLAAKKPLVMGVLNVTPDSFSDGGMYKDVDDAVKRALAMVEEGADIIDIGGESTGPDSSDVLADEELERVIPVFEKLRMHSDVLLSVDTYKHHVALHALNVGANIVNDVTALRGDPDMAKSLAQHDAPVILMYSKDERARTTSEKIQYDDVLQTIGDFLDERLAYAVQSGIARERLIIDPGMGAFVSGDARYSLQILKHLDQLKKWDLPILVGPSRKSFIGDVLGLPVEERVEGGLAACSVAVMNGASILRVHDVQKTRRAVDMTYAILNS